MAFLYKAVSPDYLRHRRLRNTFLHVLCTRCNFHPSLNLFFLNELYPKSQRDYFHFPYNSDYQCMLRHYHRRQLPELEDIDVYPFQLKLSHVASSYYLLDSLNWRAMARFSLSWSSLTYRRNWKLSEHMHMLYIYIYRLELPCRFISAFSCKLA